MQAHACTPHNLAGTAHILKMELNQTIDRSCLSQGRSAFQAWLHGAVYGAHSTWLNSCAGCKLTTLDCDQLVHADPDEDLLSVYAARTNWPGYEKERVKNITEGLNWKETKIEF